MAVQVFKIVVSFHPGGGYGGQFLFRLHASVEFPLFPTVAEVEFLIFVEDWFVPSLRIPPGLHVHRSTKQLNTFQRH